MINEVQQDAEQRMQRAVEAFRRELATLRAGRATPALVEKISVDYYGTRTPLNQLATITAPEARMLVIQPWDKNVLENIEKAVLQSDLGVTPQTDGTVIRINIPQLTEERRSELVRAVRSKAEEHRIIIRNVRRDANDTVRQLTDESEISEDASRRAQARIQELTDTYTGQVDGALAAKEAELTEV